MNDLKLTLTVNDDRIDMSLDEGSWSYAEFMTTILSLLDGQTQHFLEEVKNDTDEDSYQQVKCSVYDELNFLFGQILERIIPDGSDDFEANLTTEAILKAENEIIREKYEQMQENADTED